MFAHYDQAKRFVAPTLVWRLSVGVLTLVAMAGASYSAWAWHMNRMFAPPADRWHFLRYAVGTAADSPWATWFGIPVSMPAMALYGAMALTLCRVGPGSPPHRQGRAWRVLLALSLLVLGATAWFVVMQVMWLDHICGLCVLGGAAGSLAAVAVILRAPIRLQHRRRPQPDPIKIRRHTFVWLSGAALAAVAVLVTGQILTGWMEHQNVTLAQNIRPAQTRPINRAIQAAPDESFSAEDEYGHQNVDLTSAMLLPSPPLPATQSSEISRAPTPFRFRFGIRLNPLEFPLLGRPDAPALALWIFDYHDPSSRVMYRQIEEVRRRFGSQLAIIAVPVDAPRSAIRATDYVPTTQPVEPKDDLTALAIIVSRAKPAAFEAFHAFLLGSDPPPTLEAARRNAASLIGEEQLRVLYDTRDVQDQMLRHVAILKRSEFPWVPQLRAGGVAAAVMPQDPQAQNALMEYFQKNLNLRPGDSPLPSSANNISDPFSTGHP